MGLPGWSDVAGVVYLIQEHVWELPRGRCQCHTDEHPGPDGLLAFPALCSSVSQVNSHTESQWFPTVLAHPGPGLGLAVSFVEQLINTIFSHYIGILEFIFFSLSYLLYFFVLLRLLEMKSHTLPQAGLEILLSQPLRLQA